MNKNYDFGIVIGRFQPFHSAHRDLIRHALTLAEKVIIILGSARHASDVKNPFTPAMREEMIRACFPGEAAERLIFRAVRDYPYNDHVWTTEIQNVAREIVEENDENRQDDREQPQHHAQIALVGFFKDRTSYYLNLFPQWQFEEFYSSHRAYLKANASEIREKYFAAENADWKELLPPQVVTQLEVFRQTETFANLKKEFDYLRKYKADTRFVGAPYEPTFITTDAVVVQSGHVLVIRRGHQPGKGLLALPGGFLIKDLTLEDSAIKELKEETQIKVPAAVLRGSIKASRAFDYPERSQRGRTVTFAYFIELEPSLKDGLPRVKGGDDAAKAFWLPLSALGENEDEFFEDHIHIIRYFLGL
ncbi:MAG: bifunctional nicotinamide-nucleotide adenylyltransferase/Nudix hydroxylase [Acidobacteriota bacterium]|nr:bifunctional nicotinamide-nucleotide adenylyltransferase/Nudix hydroxylase [Acidobacteriota bacterium]